MQLVIPLSRTGTPLFRQVYLGLRQNILSGVLRAGDRLPSSRDLAEQLGISRTIVVLAYEHLLSEGFVEGRTGSGTYVSAGLRGTNPRVPGKPAQIRLSRFGMASESAAARVNFLLPRRPVLRYDFAYGRAQVSEFPFEVWGRSLLHKARSASVEKIDYAPAAGSVALRNAICDHLRRSRAVVCEPSQVIVVNGSQQALDLVARVLIERGDSVAIEDPQYQGTREVLRACRARIHPVRVDREGLNPAKLPKGARVVFVTPSHQFPTGAILPLARRMALLEWAKRNQAVIVEDDYDGEFRYEGHPLESLQGLDTEGRVIYIGTFSRTIFSALRIGYLIAPQSLVRAFTTAKWLCDRHTPTLEQETLAEFIASGMYERHLHRIRRRNAARRAALLDSVQKYIADRAELTGDGAGAHIVLWPKTHDSEDAIVARAAGSGVGVYGISGYFLARPAPPGLMLGYSRLNEQEIREGIKRLGDVL
ncbi:MAG TPA: PLP-dependent aminotransferase family protein [Terriglobales bacterium]|nr:PLP-dependent aminotransferase family protein [Terriglobales bacterium]